MADNETAKPASKPRTLADILGDDGNAWGIADRLEIMAANRLARGEPATDVAVLLIASGLYRVVDKLEDIERVIRE